MNCRLCENPTKARGLCNRHYQQWQKSPDYNKIRPHTYPSLQAAFDHWPKHADANGCLIWDGNTMGTNGAYGKLRFDAQVISAHRAAYELAYGVIPAGYRVDHRCHITLCVNPNHLRLATQKENGENRKGPNRNNRTGLRGINYDHNRGQFRVRIKHNYYDIMIGRFNTLEDAMAAAIKARSDHFTHSDGR